jgi:metal-responsive CopG/Arc/MetJ family transcriptional regulator
MKTITITLDDELVASLRKAAQAQGGRSISSLIREACAEKLERESANQPATEEAAA